MSEQTSNFELPPKLQLYKIADRIYKDGVEETLNLLETRSNFDDDAQAAQYKRVLSVIKSGRERNEVWIGESSGTFSFRGSSQAGIGGIDRDNGTYEISIWSLPGQYEIGIWALPGRHTTQWFDLSKIPLGNSKEKCMYMSKELIKIIISPEYPPYLTPYDNKGYVEKLKELGEEPPFISDDEAMVLLNSLNNSNIDLDTTILHWDEWED